MKKCRTGISTKSHCGARPIKDCSDRQHDLDERHEHHDKTHTPDVARIATGNALVDDVGVQRG